MKKSNKRKLKVEWTILKESEKEKLAFENIKVLLAYSMIVCIESIIDWNEWNW